MESNDFKGKIINCKSSTDLFLFTILNYQNELHNDTFHVILMRKSEELVLNSTDCSYNIDLL